MKLHELLEARRNPEQNPKLSLIDVLRKYKDDPNIFITFRGVPHLNINTRYTFNTPMGVYFYPLQALWKKYKYDFENYKLPSQYAVGFRYCFISRYNGKGKKEIRDTNAYTHADRMRDFDELRKLGYDVDNAFSQIPDNSYTQNEFGKFWNTVNVLTQHISGKGSLGTNLLALEKNKILRKLGYAYISEPGGSGILHPNEAEQGFFTSAAFIKTINMVDTQPGGGFTYVQDFKLTLEDRFHEAVMRHNDKIWSTLGDLGYSHWITRRKSGKTIKWDEWDVELKPMGDINSSGHIEYQITQTRPMLEVLGYIRIHIRFRMQENTITVKDVDNATELTTKIVPKGDVNALCDRLHEILYVVLKNSKAITDIIDNISELKDEGY